MAKFVNITANDTILTTAKVTKGLFTGDLGTVQGTSFTTSSLSTTQKSYYKAVQLSSEDQFSVAYGHKEGSGSADEATNTFGKTRALYKQFASMLLPFEQVEGGFIINDVTQSDCFFIQMERARMKDRMNKKNWTLTLGGVNTALTASVLKLTDNSNTNSSSIHSPVGQAYHIVSGTAGSVHNHSPYGLFYPTVGILVLSQQRLSSSIPGSPGYEESGSALSHTIHPGFKRDADTSADNAGKFINCLFSSGSFTARSEEDQTSATYFCRARAPEFNFSNNPTFVTGSVGENRNEFRIPEMEGDPQVFITTVGLYDANDHLMAVGKLSSPILKNYGSEATIKVKLTY